MAVKPDVIIVHNGRAVREGMDVKTAAAGNCLVGADAARHLTYLISVGARSEVLGVYEITGYHPVPEEDEGRRIRFHISECDKRVVGEIPRMYGAFIYKHSSEMFDGVPTPSRLPVIPPPRPVVSPDSTVCPLCQLVHPSGRPEDCPW